MIILLPIIIVLLGTLGILVITHLAISFMIKDYTEEEQQEVWKNLLDGFNNGMK
jgi:hypothetical protein